MFDPWAELADTPHVRLRRARLHRARAYTDGRSIWLDDRHSAIEARCALTHELVHIRHGHTGHQRPAIEDKVRADTARLLVPWTAVLDHTDWDSTWWTVAEMLQVTPEVLMDRVRWATDQERSELQFGAHRRQMGS